MVTDEDIDALVESHQGVNQGVPSAEDRMLMSLISRNRQPIN
jgi:hypothetical protein